MAKDLIIGSAGLLDFGDSIGQFLASNGVEIEIGPWMDRPDTIAAISCLNGAAVVELLRHAAAMEGYADERAGFSAGEEGKLLKNFPWWDNSLWLPLDFDDAGTLDDDPTFFVGSCQGLIGELDELKGKSPLRLGEVPPIYADMRADFQSFVRSDAELGLSAEDCVRWVWKALRDGAELALAENAALWAGPD